MTKPKLQGSFVALITPFKLAAGKEMAVMCCDSPHLGLVPAVMALGGHGTANMTGNIAPAEMAIISNLKGEEPCAKNALS